MSFHLLHLEGVLKHDLVGFVLFSALLAFDFALFLDLLSADGQLPGFLALAVLVPLLHQFLSLFRPEVRLAILAHLFFLSLIKIAALVHLLPHKLRVQVSGVLLLVVLGLSS